MLVYIYVLIDPRTDEIRYIGKTTNIKERYIAHMCPGSLQPKTQKNSWLKNLQCAGLIPRILPIDRIDETEWQERERWWIAYGHRQGWPLTNTTDGGLGGSFKGHTLTEEHKRKIGEANRKRLTGRKLTEAHCRAISKGNKGKHADKHVSEETRQKLSKIAKNWWNNLSQERLGEVKEALSEAQKKRWDSMTDEERAVHSQKTSKGLIGKLLSEAHKHTLSEAHKGKKLSKEHKQKIGEGQKGWWANASAEERQTRIDKMLAARKEKHGY